MDRVIAAGAPFPEHPLARVAAVLLELEPGRTQPVVRQDIVELRPVEQRRRDARRQAPAEGSATEVRSQEPRQRLSADEAG